jgi:hypothetical protein
MRPIEVCQSNHIPDNINAESNTLSTESRKSTDSSDMHRRTVKGIYYPSRTKRLIRRTNHKESKIKSIRERVLERMKEPKEFSHPYEKKFRKSRKKYVAPISTILTRSMKRSQEFPFTGLDALVEETIKSQRPKPSKKRSKTANVSL